MITLENLLKFNLIKMARISGMDSKNSNFNFIYGRKF